MATAWEVLRTALEAPAAGGVLLDAALKAFVILSLAGGLTLVLRPASASLRHLIWTLAIVAALAVPAIAPLLPAWRVPGLSRLLPSRQVEFAVPSEGAEPRELESVKGNRAAPLTHPDGETAPRPAASERDDAPVFAAGLPGPPAEDESESLLGERVTVQERPAAVRMSEKLAGQTWLILAWLAGSLLLGVGIAAGLARTWWLGRRARRLTSGRLVDLRDELSRRLGIGRPVTLLQARPGSMPVTWGALRPKVMLPADAAGWPEARLRAVLAHELAHVKRLDYLTQLLARMLCALHWFNPLAWIAARRLRVERELACDDEVLRFGSRASDYAGHLLDIARSLRAGALASVTSVAMARPSQLSGRLLAVLDPRRARTALSAKLIIPAALVAALIVMPIAAAAPGAAEAGPPGEGEAVAARPEPAETPAAEEVKDGGGWLRPASLALGLTVSGELPDAAQDTSAEPASVGAAIRGAVLATLDSRSIPSAYALDCDWHARGGRRSSSISIDDDDMRIKIGRGDCRLEIMARGELVFNETDTDIVAIRGAGYFEIEESEGRSSRRLMIESKGGVLERRWFVDRDERPYDAEAQAWLANLIPVLFRQVGIQAEERASRILAQGGPEELLQEISLIPSDHTARRYYAVLLTQADLSPAQVREIVEQAGSEISSDHELAQLLIAIAEAQPLDEAVRVAYVGAAGSISSDYEQRRVLSAILQRDDLSDAVATSMLQSATEISSDYELAQLLVDLLATFPLDGALAPEFFRAVETIDSDYEQRRVLDAALSRGALDLAILDMALESATKISSDHELGQLLIAVARVYPVDQQIPDSYLAAARTISSDYELGRVLALLLERDDLSAAAVSSLLELAQTMSSDHEISQLLQRVTREHGVSDANRAAFFGAAGTIDSDYELRRVLSGVLQSKPLSESAVEAVLKSALEISSDYEMSSLLVEVAENVEISERLRPAFMRAADSISSEQQRGRVLSALLPRSG